MARNNNNNSSENKETLTEKEENKQTQEETVAVNEENKKGTAEQEQNTDKKIKLEALIPFTDKNTNEHYIAGDKIEVDKERADELLKDQRKLVKLASK